VRVITYTYDPLYRLVKADYSTGELFEYAYDSVGNRTRYTETTPALARARSAGASVTATNVTTYAYDAANRLTNVGGVAYTWDDNGNLISDGSKTYTYTQANRFVAVSDQQSAASFVYRCMGLSRGRANF
jgi:YD repeat-containing protein